jgi:hypothetical protein
MEERMMNRKFVKLAAAMACVAVAMTASLKTASADTLYYNPVVEVVGNGSGALTNATTPVAIEVFQNSTAGQLVPSSSAAYATSGGTELLNSGTATSEGALANNPLVPTQAALGQSYTGSAAYVYNAGYDMPLGSPGIASSTSGYTAAGQTTVTGGVASNARVLLTQLRSANYSGNNIRAEVGANDSAFPTIYTAGTGTGTNASWRNYTTSTPLSSVANTRIVEETYAPNGTAQLFGASDTGSTVGISLINVSAGTSSLFLQTATASANASPYAFVLLDDTANLHTIDGYNVAYIADDGTGSSEAAGNAGIEKWTYNGSAWTKKYTILGSGLLPSGSAATGYRGLAGQQDGAGSGDVILFTTDASSTVLQQVTDPISATTLPAGENASFITLATAPTNEVFRGVALAPAAVPEPSTFALLAAGACGLVCCIRRHQASRRAG